MLIKALQQETIAQQMVTPIVLCLFVFKRGINLKIFPQIQKKFSVITNMIYYSNRCREKHNERKTTIFSTHLIISSYKSDYPYNINISS